MRYLVIKVLVHMNFLKIRQNGNRDLMSNFRNQKSLDFYIVSSFSPVLLYFLTFLVAMGAGKKEPQLQSQVPFRGFSAVPKAVNF